MGVISRDGVGNQADVFPVPHFCTGTLPVDLPFDVWGSAPEAGIARLPAAEAPAGFRAAFSSWNLGEIVLTHAVFSGTPARPWRPRLKSDQDHWCVVLARTKAADGTLCEELSLRSPAAAGEGPAREGEVITLYLPRKRAPAEDERADAGHDVVVSRALAPLLGAYMDGLVRHLPRLDPERAASLEMPTRALATACIASSLAGAEPARPVLGSALVDRARSVVRQNMASPDFGPDGLARLLAMSRSKLYRLFEQSGGVAHFINRERLHEAHRRLSEQAGTLSIHAIGNEVGFVDHSTFSRAFRREFGYSPTEARERGLVRSFAEERNRAAEG